MWQQPKTDWQSGDYLISEIITASRAISMRYAPRPLPCGQTLNLRKWERIRHIRITASMQMKLTTLRPI